MRSIWSKYAIPYYAVKAERCETLSPLYAPEFERLVIRSRENVGSIWSKNTGLNCLSMTFEGMKELTRGSFPELERLV